MRTIEIAASQYICKCDFLSTRYQLAIPTKFDENGKIIKIIGPLSCRESIAQHFVQVVRSSKPFVQTLNKARVMITGFHKNDVKPARLKKTLDFIHRIEDASGILPRTTVRVVKTPWSQSSRIMMFEGSNKWYRSSHTMSLWHLILRVCTRDIGLASTTTDEELLKYTAKWRIEITSNGQHWAREDQSHVKATHTNWITLMKNVNEIFPKNVHWTNRYNIAKIYPKPKPHVYTQSISRDGIRNFITGKSAHNSLKTFEKFKE